MYSQFAYVYDRLMGDIPYDRFAAWIEESLVFLGCTPSTILDLGCGTGAMFDAMMRLSRQVIGIDPSSEMLAVASEKAITYGQRITLMQGDATTFRVPRKGDACIAICDVFNYLLDMQPLQTAFSRVKASLKDDGLFFFDMHTLHKIHDVLGNNVYYEADDDAIMLMQTHVEEETSTVNYSLMLFLQEADGRYRLEEESHQQRAYPLEGILQALKEAGFREVYIGADFSFPWSQNLMNTNDKENSFHVTRLYDESDEKQFSRWQFLAR